MDLGNYSELSFSDLVQHHYPGSLRLARSILRHDTEAADAVQTAYGNAFRNISGFREESSFGTWISRIVVNQCLMRLRQMRRAPAASLDDLGVDVPTPLYPSSRLPRPDEVYEQREAAAAISTAVDRLPDTLRSAWTMHELDGLSLRDLSQSLGISIPATKSRLFRARAELRRSLKTLLGARPFGGTLAEAG